MTCRECLPLLDAYADGELDLVRHVDLEAHLKACPGCARRAEVVSARLARLRSGAGRFAAPPQFRSRILDALRAEAGNAKRTEPVRIPAARSPWNLAAVAASLAAALAAGYTLGDRRAHSASLLDQAFGDHVRSLQADHLMDVVSTDRHTVKPWFAGKLDFSPPVADLADVGFPLAGGRLERIDGRAAAALVFRRRLHVVNLFVWPAPGAANPPGSAASAGYSALGWSQGGLNFLAVSDIPAADLEQFADEFRKRTR
jgi:anti-sigma factor RsiW